MIISQLEFGPPVDGATDTFLCSVTTIENSFSTVHVSQELNGGHRIRFEFLLKGHKANIANIEASITEMSVPQQRVKKKFRLSTHNLCCCLRLVKPTKMQEATFVSDSYYCALHFLVDCPQLLKR